MSNNKLQPENEQKCIQCNWFWLYINHVIVNVAMRDIRMLVCHSTITNVAHMSVMIYDLWKMVKPLHLLLLNDDTNTELFITIIERRNVKIELPICKSFEMVQVKLAHMRLFLVSFIISISPPNHYLPAKCTDATKKTNSI